jgi:quinolinate synthase
MADMITPRELAEVRRGHPDALVVSYVNTTAAIKAESDICCTSANAAQVVNSLPPEREIIFVPDRNLGGWVAGETGRKNMLLWRGFCPTHNRILERDVREARAAHPGALVVVHPECRPEVRALADRIASTSGMVRFARESAAQEFIIGTELGMIHRLERECPGKRFHPVTKLADCPNMKLTTLEKVLWELEDLAHPVELPPALIERARRPLEKMVEVLGA